MKKARSILFALFIILGAGLFCYLFFPWPLWPLFWFLASLVGVTQLFAPVREDSEYRKKQEKPPDFSDFDDQIKWDKFR